MIIWMPKMTRIMPNEMLHKVQNFGSNSTGPEAGLIITRSQATLDPPLNHPLNLGSGSTGPEAGLMGITTQCSLKAEKISAWLRRARRPAYS